MKSGRTAGHYPIHTLVGHDADMRTEQRTQKAGLYPVPTWVGNGADAAIRQDCRALPDTHLVGNDADARRSRHRKQIALQGFPNAHQCG